MAGRVGRPSIPSNVHYLHGNPSKKSAAALLGEFQPDVELAKCPPHLKAEAKKEYLRLGEELVRYNLVSKIDRGVLAMLATVWARYVWAEDKIAQLNADDPHHERGYIGLTPNNYQVMSVHLQISNAAISLYVKMAGEFGLTAAARTRVKPSDGVQMPLPGVPERPETDAPSLRSFAS